MAFALQNRATMRRLVALLGLLPGIALADVTQGTVVGYLYGTTAATTTQNNFIGKAQCAGTQKVKLEWNIQSDTTAGWTTGGTYKIFASDKAPGTGPTGTSANYCPETPDPNFNIHAGVVGAEFVAATQDQSLEVSGADIVAAAGITCSAGTTVYLCVHYISGTSGTRAGYAKAQFTTTTLVPNDPTNLAATPGDSALNIGWGSGVTTGSVTPLLYEVKAVNKNDATETHLATTNSTSLRLSGLTNNQTYDVTVVAIANGSNQSAVIGPAEGTPLPGLDFYQYYVVSGGDERGGCGSGPAGLAALGGLALAFGLRRRSK